MSKVEILKELKNPNIIEYCGYFLRAGFGNRGRIEDSEGQSNKLDQLIDEQNNSSKANQNILAGKLSTYRVIEFADGGDMQ